MLGSSIPLCSVFVPWWHSCEGRHFETSSGPAPDKIVKEGKGRKDVSGFLYIESEPSIRPFLPPFRVTSSFHDLSRLVVPRPLPRIEGETSPCWISVCEFIPTIPPDLFHNSVPQFSLVPPHQGGHSFEKSL